MSLRPVGQPLHVSQMMPACAELSHRRVSSTDVTPKRKRFDTLAGPSSQSFNRSNVFSLNLARF